MDTTDESVYKIETSRNIIEQEVSFMPVKNVENAMTVSMIDCTFEGNPVTPP